MGIQAEAEPHSILADYAKGSDYLAWNPSATSTTCVPSGRLLNSPASSSSVRKWGDGNLLVGCSENKLVHVKT